MDAAKMQDDKKTSLELDTSELSPAQVRQIKTLVTMVTHLSKTSEESEFFEGSSEVMRLCASLITQANFPTRHASNENIPYEQQAIEYAMDIVHEHLSSSRVVNYDN